MFALLAVPAAWALICIIVNTARYRSLEEGLRVTFTGKPTPEAREKLLNRPLKEENL